MLRSHILPENITFETLYNPDDAVIDVVFVHGLTGDPKSTWASANGFWPDWLAEDNPTAAFHTIGFPASKLKKWLSKELDVFELAKSATEYLCGYGIGKRPVVFIAHSLGGILTKLILAHCNGSSDSEAAELAQKVVRVMFLATPHNAPSFASVAKYVMPKLSSAHVTVLAGETTVLTKIGEDYKKYSGVTPLLKNIAYYEAQHLAGLAMIVSKEDADPGITGTTPIPIEADHLSICKPNSRDSMVHVSVSRHIRQALKCAHDHPELSSSETKTFGDDYSVKAEHDRRELLEKMVAADRENEYGYANRQQNKFARPYVALGLLPGTRADHDMMLSEVEQRFQSQVFFPHICEGSDKQTIQEAVQKNVVEPLAGKAIGETVFGAATIQSAIYFLTEQCHIRWDPET
ncbi:ABC-three component system protein [Jannaschia sp. 2305UL9-9]|uniref:ABC-three component system protein n=1 Tax=Jannaschia sp. 2305UL9-9 TaxID=3121638 RepID=UPI003527DC08